jgi:hypothetical protein
MTVTRINVAPLIESMDIPIGHKEGHNDHQRLEVLVQAQAVVQVRKQRGLEIPLGSKDILILLSYDGNIDNDGRCL